VILAKGRPVRSKAPDVRRCGGMRRPTLIRSRHEVAAHLEKLRGHAGSRFGGWSGERVQATQSPAFRAARPPFGWPPNRTRWAARVPTGHQGQEHERTGKTSGGDETHAPPDTAGGLARSQLVPMMLGPTLPSDPTARARGRPLLGLLGVSRADSETAAFRAATAPSTRRLRPTT